MRSRTILCTALAGLAVLAAGCGDDGSLDPAKEQAARPLTRAELNKRADAICARFTAQADKVQPTLDSTEGASRFYGQLAAISRKRIAALQRLRPADDVRSDFEAFIAASDKATDAIDQVAAKGRTGDEDGVDAVDVAGPTEAAKQATQQLGATACL